MGKKPDQWLTCHFILLSFLIHEIQEKNNTKRKNNLSLGYLLFFQVTLWKLPYFKNFQRITSPVSLFWIWHSWKGETNKTNQIHACTKSCNLSHIHTANLKTQGHNLAGFCSRKSYFCKDNPRIPVHVLSQTQHTQFFTSGVLWSRSFHVPSYVVLSVVANVC